MLGWLKSKIRNELLPRSGMGGSLINNENGNGMRVSDVDEAQFRAWASANPCPFKSGQIVSARGKRWLIGERIFATALHGAVWQIEAMPVDEPATYSTLLFYEPGILR